MDAREAATRWGETSERGWTRGETAAIADLYAPGGWAVRRCHLAGDWFPDDISAPACRPPAVARQSGERQAERMLVTVDRPKLERRARLLAWATIVWNVIEAVVAIASGVVAESLALVGFGIDSSIEVFAAVVVLWRLRGIDEEREQRALKLIAVSFFVLGAYVAIEAVRDFIGDTNAATSPVGIGLAIASLLVMPVLAVTKKRTGVALGNRTVIADAAETKLCTYLSAILLAGLVLDATLHWWWADPVAALGIAFLAVREGREAWEGDDCC